MFSSKLLVSLLTFSFVITAPTTFASYSDEEVSTPLKKKTSFFAQKKPMPITSQRGLPIFQEEASDYEDDEDEERASQEQDEPESSSELDSQPSKRLRDENLCAEISFLEEPIQKSGRFFEEEDAYSLYPFFDIISLSQADPFPMTFEPEPPVILTEKDLFQKYSVIFNSLLPNKHISWNDILNFRQASKTSRTFFEQYFKRGCVLKAPIITSSDLFSAQSQWLKTFVMRSDLNLALVLINNRDDALVSYKNLRGIALLDYAVKRAEKYRGNNLLLADILDYSTKTHSLAKKSHKVKALRAKAVILSGLKNSLNEPKEFAEALSKVNKITSSWGQPMNVSGDNLIPFLIYPLETRLTLMLHAPDCLGDTWIGDEGLSKAKKRNLMIAIQENIEHLFSFQRQATNKLDDALSYIEILCEFLAGNSPQRASLIKESMELRSKSLDPLSAKLLSSTVSKILK